MTQLFSLAFQTSAYRNCGTADVLCELGLQILTLKNDLIWY